MEDLVKKVEETANPEAKTMTHIEAISKYADKQISLDELIEKLKIADRSEKLAEENA